MLEIERRDFNIDQMYFPFWRDLILDEVERYKTHSCVVWAKRGVSYKA